MSADKDKAKVELARAYRDHLSKRIPELHKAGVEGADARRLADREWAEKLRGG